MNPPLKTDYGCYVLRLGAIAALALNVAVLSQQANAAAIQSLDRDPRHRSVAAAQDDVGYLKLSIDGITGFGSAILVSGASADWAIVAAHEVIGPTGGALISQLTVGTSTSYLQPQFGIEVGVEEIWINPFYNPNAPGNQGDYAFLRLSSRVLRDDQYFSIGPPPGFDDILLFTGYGDPSLIGAGSLPIDGFRRSFTAVATLAVAGNLNPEFYNGGNFRGVSIPITEPLGLENIEGIGTGHDSGGSVKNLSGDTIGLMTSRTSSATFYLDFNHPQFKADLATVVQPRPVPEPATGTFLLSGMMGFLAQRFRRRQEMQVVNSPNHGAAENCSGAAARVTLAAPRRPTAQPARHAPPPLRSL